MAIIDYYEALTNDDRFYRKSMAPLKALKDRDKKLLFRLGILIVLKLFFGIPNSDIGFPQSSGSRRPQNQPRAVFFKAGFQQMIGQRTRGRRQVVDSVNFDPVCRFERGGHF